MIRWCLPLVFLSLALGMARAEDEDAVARLKAEMALRARVAPAVERAAAWIRTLQAKDGALRLGTQVRKEDLPKQVRDSLPDGVVTSAPTHVFGKTALGVLALTHAGVKAEDPVLVRALVYLRRHYRGVMTKGYASQGATYSMALLLMALHDYYHLPDAPVDVKANPRGNPSGLPAHDLAIVRLVGRWFLRTRTESGLFSYPYPPMRVNRRIKGHAKMMAQTYDMSNTQYAMLGLWAAARCGFDVPAAALESIAEKLLAVQSPHGAPVVRRFDPTPGAPPGTHTVATARDRARGFGYVGGAKMMSADFHTGSMTAAGLSSLLIVKALLEEREALEPHLGKRLEHGIWDAIGWLAVHYRIDANPGAVETTHLPPETAKKVKGLAKTVPSMWHYYYLYGLERAMVIAGKRYVGTHDWWMEGARLLLDAQAEGGWWAVEANGAFSMIQSRLLETSFAVLFLRRATLRPRSPLIEVHVK